MLLKNLKLKIIIVLLLAIAAVILLFFVPEKENYGDEVDVPKSVKTKEEIKVSLSGEIDSVLSFFGIKKEWINTATAQNSPEWFLKEVQLPYSIYAGAVVSDLIKHLLQYDYTVESAEEFNPNPLVPVNLSARIKDLNVKSETPVARINFIYRENLKRETGEICIVLNKFESFEREQAAEIINTQTNLTFVMPNLFELIDVQAMMIDSRSDYINCFEIGEANNYEVDFRDQKNNSANQSSNRKRMYQICNDYDKEKPLVLLNPLKINETQTEIYNDLSKCRGGNVYIDTILIVIDLRKERSLDGINFENLIKEKTKNGTVNKAILLSIAGGDYDDLTDCLSGMEKAGYKFYYFKDFLKRQSREK